MANTCSTCNVVFKSRDQVISCGNCKMRFHCDSTCLSVSATDIRSLQLSTPVLVYLCIKCRPGGLTQFSSAFDFSKLFENIETIKTNTENCAVVNSDYLKFKEEFPDLSFSTIGHLKKELQEQSTSTTISVVKEVNSQNVKSKNALIYGVKDKNKYKGDETFIKNLLKTCKLDFGVVEHRRLGTFSKNKSRPLQCIFDSASEVSEFLSKSDLYPDDIKVNRDRTLLQRKALKEAISVIENYKNEGKKDFIIKYVDGFASVVPKNK